MTSGEDLLCAIVDVRQELASLVPVDKHQSIEAVLETYEQHRERLSSTQDESDFLCLSALASGNEHLIDYVRRRSFSARTVEHAAQPWFWALTGLDVTVKYDVTFEGHPLAHLLDGPLTTPLMARLGPAAAVHFSGLPLDLSKLVSRLREIRWRSAKGHSIDEHLLAATLQYHGRVAPEHWPALGLLAAALPDYTTPSSTATTWRQEPISLPNLARAGVQLPDPILRHCHAIASADREKAETSPAFLQAWIGASDRELAEDLTNAIRSNRLARPALPDPRQESVLSAPAIVSP